MELTPPDPRVGQVLHGRYRIIERLAAGAMGVVYRGERVRLGRQVAVKFLHPWIAAQPAFRARFETEARAMSRLSHPNCVSVIDFGLEGSPYVVMDFVPGLTLRHVLVESGRLAPPRAVAIARQILAGVAHAHAHGIIHRDLKPENLILGDAAGIVDHVRILDFGLAKLRDGPAMTAGLAIGTPGYMSPEQTGAPGEIDGRTDIYAVGILLFEMLAGRKPFVSENIAEVLLMQRDTPPPSVRQMIPDAGVSRELEGVINRALAKRPEDRFQTAAELAQALDQLPEAPAGRSAGSFPAPAPGMPDAGSPASASAAAAAADAAEKTIADPLPGQGADVAADAGAAAVSPGPRARSPASRSNQSTPSVVRGWIGLGAMAALALGLVVLGVQRQPTTSADDKDGTHRSGAGAPPVAGGPPAAAPGPAAAAASSLAPGQPAPPGGAEHTGQAALAGSPASPPRSAVPTGTVIVASTSTPARAEARDTVSVEGRLLEADGLSASGQSQRALAVLEQAHREYPDEPTVSYRLANLLLENKRWSEGAQAARAAGQHDRKYRSDERLVRNLIRSLASDKGYEKTEDVLHGFGSGPVPLLKEAAARDPNPVIRQRATELLRARAQPRDRDDMARGVSRPAAHATSSRSLFSR